MIYITYSCLSLVLAAALIKVPVQAQSSASSSNSDPSSSTPTDSTTDPTTSATATTTTTTTTTTDTSTAATTAPATSTATTTIDTTTTVSPTTTITTTTSSSIPTTISDTSTTSAPPTTLPTSFPTTTSDTKPTFSSSWTTIPSTYSSSPTPLPSSNPGSSSSTTDNVPIIVGSVVGIIAVAIIATTSLICYRRRRHNNLELTFNALQGMGPSKGDHGYLTSGSPTLSGGAIGLNSATTGGYDDGYDYEMQSNSGYTSQQEYNVGGYEISPHQGYLPHPPVFQEAYNPSMAPYMTASSMSHNHVGFDQNLPESMYNRNVTGEPNSGAGYYNDLDAYGNGTWNQGPKQGLWVVNPEDEYSQHSNYYGDTDPQNYTTDENATSADKGLPDSPILQASTLRGGDLFGRDGGSRPTSPKPTSSRPTSPRPTSPRPTSPRPTSPRPTSPRPTYANDYIHTPSDGNESNQNKSLRGFRYPE
ncbi:hypothetical protein BGZ80_006250 [Entomortierella chlamydospora]|uniref:Uncharacterized protein n=1 Tax=Entomortierella chlamydospora TaxID=101097 RepID=A0A9P6T201_9FUNG|nr:hypothetical protein BGZ79_001465 [Entomortierella chlamydospora]KAG0019135.1 hypothetical protein BGZ80_006250 [Entomortierella chlamydospora]